MRSTRLGCKLFQENSCKFQVESFNAGKLAAIRQRLSPRLKIIHPLGEPSSETRAVKFRFLPASHALQLSTRNLQLVLHPHRIFTELHPQLLHQRLVGTDLPGIAHPEAGGGNRVIQIQQYRRITALIRRQGLLQSLG